MSPLVQSSRSDSEAQSETVQANGGTAWAEDMHCAAFLKSSGMLDAFIYLHYLQWSLEGSKGNRMETSLYIEFVFSLENTILKMLTSLRPLFTVS